MYAIQSFESHTRVKNFSLLIDCYYIQILQLGSHYAALWLNAIFLKEVDLNHDLGRQEDKISSVQVKNFGNEGIESDKLSKAIDKYQGAEFTMLMSFNVISLLQGTIVFSATILGLVLCVKVR